MVMTPEFSNTVRRPLTVTAFVIWLLFPRICVGYSMSDPLSVLPSTAPPPPAFTSWADLLTCTSRHGTAFGEIPRFAQFCQHHQRRTRELKGDYYDQSHWPNILQGGKAAGPLGKNQKGQVVRVLGTYPDLTAQPRHVSDDQGQWPTFQHDSLEWVGELQRHLHVIRSEFQRVAPLLDDETSWECFRTKRGTSFSEDTGWSHIAFCDNFRWQEENIALFPETMQLLLRVVGTERRIGPRHVAIARQHAKSGIPEHSDLMNYFLTLHTVLEGPSSGAGIVIDNVRRDWVVDDPVVTDTTFVHHTYNESAEDVVLLLVDFWHPDLSVCEIDALRAFWGANSGV